jgi:hypothetical protein
VNVPILASARALSGVRRHQHAAAVKAACLDRWQVHNLLTPYGPALAKKSDQPESKMSGAFKQPAVPSAWEWFFLFRRGRKSAAQRYY